VEGLARAVHETWERYHLPIVLAEVQLAGADEDQVAWWAEAMAVADDAVSRGVKITAVTAWAAFGAYDWDSILRLSRATYEGGAYALGGDGTPRRTPLGDAVAATAAGQPIPVIRPGWWRRGERALYAPREGRRGPRSVRRRRTTTVTPAGDG